MAQNRAIVLPSTPDKRPSASDFDSIIRIKVEIFEIHKGVLKFYSGYFQKAIENIESGYYSEALDKMITLPEEEPGIFRPFQGWLYTRELPKDRQKELVRLWFFGDRRAVPLLQNEAIDGIREVNVTINTEPTTSLHYAFGKSLPDSALRRFTIWSLATRTEAQAFRKSSSDWPAEVVQELMPHMLEFRPQRQNDEWYM